jgi:murein DD-endopeptidase MepM/ murein hydrolase activator NlpD
MTGHLLAAAALTLVGLQADGTALEIRHRARSLAPGELVLVEVESREPLRQLSAEWLGRTVAFYPLEPRRWQGLAPIDLSTSPGRYTLLVSATRLDGVALSGRHPIAIVPRRFAARRLTVPPAFVEPPAEAQPRIAAEREAVEAILSLITGERLWSGPFVVPVPGPATSSFGRRTILNGRARGQHSGTDFQAPLGTQVVAPNRGRVALAADHYFAGRTIVLDHGLGVYSLLAHLSSLSVAQGDTVERGQAVALTGVTGRVTGPHLHWAIRVSGARVDPLSLVAVLQDGAGPTPRR